MPGEVTDPMYWVRQVRETVRFGDGVRRLREKGVTRFLEIGPDTVLATQVGDASAVLRRDRNETETLLLAVAELHVTGVPVGWSAIAQRWGGRRIPLPTYPFDRERFWPKPLVETAARDGWRYRIEWTPVLCTVAPLTGTWLVLEPAGPGERDTGIPGIAEALRNQGADTIVVPVDTRDRSVLAARLAELDNLDELRGVVSLLAFDEADGLAATVVLAQALRDAEITAPVWALTRGAVSVVATK